jgi:hypothetical protein
MNMMKTTLGVLLVVGAFLGRAEAFAHGVTLAKAAELGLHRVERLVILCNLGDPNQPVNIPGQAGYDPSRCKNDPSKPPKGVDPDYQNRLNDILVEAIPHVEEDEPSFRITVAQHPGMDGTQRKVVIVLDEEGRPLTNDVIAGAAPSQPVMWPGKDPTTLSENALHYVQDAAAVNRDLIPFRDALVTMTVVQERNPAGQVIARVDVTSSDTAKVLKIRLDAAGNFMNFEIVAGAPTFTQVKQVFVARCLGCHSATGTAARVPLGTLEDLINSPRQLVLPGNWEDSGLYIAVSRTDDRRMPPPRAGDPLNAGQIELFRLWIETGAAG